jgi:hypothetical protein
MHRVAALEKIQIIHAKKQIRLIGKQPIRIRLTNLIYLLRKIRTKLKLQLFLKVLVFKRLAKLPGKAVLSVRKQLT